MSHQTHESLEKLQVILQEAKIEIPDELSQLSPDKLDELLNILKNQEHLASIVNHHSPIWMIKSSITLADIGILSADNLIAACKYPGELSHFLGGLVKLHQSGLLTAENRTVLLDSEHHPFLLAEVLCHLAHAGILTPDNRNAVSNHNEYIELSEGLISLKQAGILTPENRTCISQAREPQYLAWALRILNEHHILSPENRALISRHPDPVVIARSLGLLNNNNILNNTNRALIVNHHNPQAFALELINNQQELNPAQSAHTASVHQSASESAKKLMQRYGTHLSVSPVLQEIKKYIHQLDNSPRHQAAKNAIERLTLPQYVYIDPVSKVSTLELIVLFWEAIHDKTLRQGTAEEAVGLFLEALYEIQRGYNINSQQIDDQQEDIPICVAGTFNKLIEKLVGIHPDAEIRFITQQTVALKLPITVKNEILAYLNHPNTSPEICKQFLKDFEISDAIWKTIFPRVCQAMQEYRGIFRNEPEFYAFIQAGQYTGFDDKDMNKFMESINMQTQHHFNLFFASIPPIERKEQKDEKTQPNVFKK